MLAMPRRLKQLKSISSVSVDTSEEAEAMRFFSVSGSLDADGDPGFSFRQLDMPTRLGFFNR